MKPQAPEKEFDLELQVEELEDKIAPGNGGGTIPEPVPCDL